MKRLANSDEDGEGVTVRRHHPGDRAHRIRPLRFER
jgi:hypothetical protein